MEIKKRCLQHLNIFNKMKNANIFWKLLQKILYSGGQKKASKISSNIFFEKEKNSL